MKIYKPSGLDSLLDKRNRMMLRLEVLAYEISRVNKDISDFFDQTVKNRYIRFDNDNKVVHINDKGEAFIGVSPIEVYCIIEVSNTNLYDDMTFIMKGNQSSHMIVIHEKDFRDFSFVSKDEYDNI